MAIINRHTENEEIINKVLNVKIEVETNTLKRRTICFSDIKGMLSSELDIEWIDEPNKKMINLHIECLDYSMKIIEE